EPLQLPAGRCQLGRRRQDPRPAAGAPALHRRGGAARRPGRPPSGHPDRTHRPRLVPGHRAQQRGPGDPVAGPAVPRRDAAGDGGGQHRRRAGHLGPAGHLERHGGWGRRGGPGSRARRSGAGDDRTPGRGPGRVAAGAAAGRVRSAERHPAGGRYRHGGRFRFWRRTRPAADQWSGAERLPADVRRCAADRRAGDPVGPAARPGRPGRRPPRPPAEPDGHRRRGRSGL
ncbi:MAG: ABC transporter, permease protein (cluster 13, osmolytes), partial [uncultured Friedmanniella sp.]